MRLKYRKLPNSGKHHFRQNGKMICVHPGETVEAEPHELGGAILSFECLNPPPPTPEPEPPQGLYADHAGAGRWNVINPATGKAINDELLTKDEAQSLIEERLAEDTEKSEEHGTGSGDGDTADADAD